MSYFALPVQAASLFTTESRYTSSQAVMDGEFGYAVDRDGQWLVIGARRETAGTRAEGGAVYVYQRQGGSFTEYQRLTVDVTNDTNLNAGDHFGASVAVSGNAIVIGAPEYDGPDPLNPLLNSGRAYVFEFDTTSCTTQCWKFAQVLTGSGVDTTDAFGWSVDIDSTTIVVGAINDEVVTNDEGAAYIFNDNGTAWVADPASPKIGPSAGGFDPKVRFGGSVAVSGDLIAVGASGDDQFSLEAGAVHIFDRQTGWAQEDKILGQAGFESFGTAIDLDGTTLVAGAPYAMVNSQANAGLVRVYDRVAGPSWNLNTTLLPLQSDNALSDSGANDLFGSAVAIDLAGAKDYIVVGAYTNDDGVNDTGSAYLYRDTASGWGQLAKLNASDAAMSDAFGFSVAVDSDAAVIGAVVKNVVNTNDGAFYSYELTDTDDDGLSDALELKICTDTSGVVCPDINLADTDGDGITDLVELMYGDGDPTIYVAGSDLNPDDADTDNDNFTDGEEDLAGSDPLDPLDIPANGDVNGDGKVDAADLLLATRMASGLLTPTLEERLRGNVAPLAGGVPMPVDTVIGADDVLLIQRKALGLVNF